MENGLRLIPFYVRSCAATGTLQHYHEYYPALPGPLPVHAGGVPVAPTLANAGVYVCVCVVCLYPLGD